MLIANNKIEDFGLEQEKARGTSIKKQFFKMMLPFAGLAFIIIFFTLTTGGGLLKPTNLLNIISQSFTILIVSVGMAFVYGFGGFDLSLGAVSGITQLIAAEFVLSLGLDLSPLVLMLIMIMISVGLLTINGIIQVVTNVNPFIVTLCMKFICSGILTTVTSKGYLTIEYSYFSEYITPVIMIITLLVVIFLGYILFEFTSVGKSLKIIGGSRVVARQSGIDVGKSIVLAYAIGGFCLGIASFFLLGKVGIVQPSTGAGIEFNSLIAIVLGGMPLTGGANARMYNALIGAVTVTVLINGLTLMGVDVGLINGIKGLLFLVIVGLSYVRAPGKIVL